MRVVGDAGLWALALILVGLGLPLLTDYRHSADRLASVQRPLLRLIQNHFWLRHQRALARFYGFILTVTGAGAFAAAIERLAG
jgi:hypothetical protein